MQVETLQDEWLDQQRRHVRPLERLFLHPGVHLVMGWAVAVVVPALLMWGWGFWEGMSVEQWLGAGLASLSYLVAGLAVQRLSRLPEVKAAVLIVPGLTLCYGLSAAGLALLRIDFDGNYVLVSFILASAAGWMSCHMLAQAGKPLIAIVPFGRASALCQQPGAGWCLLDVPNLNRVRVDAVVADMQADLSDAWKRFLGQCTIHRIPVYTPSRALELISGKVALDQLPDEVRHGSLSPHEGYEVVKRGLDILSVLAIMPLALPLMALTSLAIRLDSPGPAIFKQRRMGLCCRQFTVYKFRSMYTDRVGRGFTEAGVDPRVTRVGKVIRKYRLDELPQLFNVLKGDMSLIGPRPESMELTEWYGKDVPFFHYRHVVRPGISGWAQVMQGYAADVDGMIEKLEYDFYYIKHVSFWLDLLIVMRTIKTLLTGFGSR
ncbi:exopolysaccharide biosynthesis polyprenyl glycosylphosphotransferase [Halomonas sp. HP20-15]|uniref:exopolysaccharide biosynthesis polyprenyl glycosylphosphotransferase n=1 Tax=Halomonas sp. HP20-15 TaxID=3085901 RepID=UPI00298202A1|nr:exopolysaccharide biosynthesis polyprenyl glycosylphosphotransferase [Halomonas sp. HP20-15]MDW5377015.1 exopolysaccharide biosynthesis polyprenyl glycosylphosphotransferase [Halomonas sp. HP20-15]